MSKVVIETERLILREWNINDAPFLVELNANPEVIKYTGDSGFKNLAKAQNLIGNYDQYEKYNMGRWLVILKETDKPIGWCGLKYSEELDVVDIGFRFLQNSWGKGYATEAGKACLKYGFKNLKIKRIVGRCMAVNKGSINVLEKLGMSFVKELQFDEHKGLMFELKNNLCFKT